LRTKWCRLVFGQVVLSGCAEGGQPGFVQARRAYVQGVVLSGGFFPYLGGGLVSGSAVRPVLRAGYGLGMLLTLLPLAEVALATRPYQPLQVIWRAGALGQLGTSLMLPLIGAFVLVGTAILLEDRALLRAFAAITAGVVVLLAGAVVVFTRDMLQLRGALQEEQLASLPITLPKVVLAYVTTSWVLSWLSVAVYRVWRRQATVARREGGSVLLVREGARP